jgi:hypothetical protein
MNEQVEDKPQKEQTLDLYWKALITDIRAVKGKSSKPVRGPLRPIGFADQICCQTYYLKVLWFYSKVDVQMDVQDMAETDPVSFSTITT